MARLITLLFSALLTAGCVSAPQKDLELAGVSSCCSGAAQFQYKKIVEGEKLTFPVSEASPAFRFPTGMSYFAPVHLPLPAKTTRSLAVSTHWATSNTRQSQVFCPSVSLYDKHFQLLSTELLMLAYQGAASKESGYWSANLSLPADAEYAVLHTESRRVGSILAVSTGESSPKLLIIGPTFVHYNPGGPIQAKYHCGHLGQLVLTVTSQ